MKKALRKDFLMEIRRSFARFVSIFLIVAMGVAFYSGIQAASPDMRYSGDEYFDENKLMDIRVVSTMGLTEEDAEAMEELPGISRAIPAYGTDVLCGEDAEQVVLHVESVLTDMNLLTVSQGRLPDKKGECFLDSDYLESSGYQIGDTISWEEADEENEFLAVHKFTIVGAGSSPMYISFARGNSTLGSGEVKGFAYVSEESFDTEVYTQVYVEVQGAREAVSYTDEYEELIERAQTRLEGIEEERCALRYDEVISEAEEKLDDARKELEDGKKEAKEKLDDAWQELQDAKQELEDGQKEYDEGVEKLANARKELADGRQQLAEGKRKYEEGVKQLQSAKTQLQEKTTEAEESGAQIAQGKEQLETARNQLNANQKKLDASQEELDGQKALLNSKQAELNSSQESLNSKQELLKQQKGALESQKQQLESQYKQSIQGVTDEAVLEAARMQYEAAAGQIEQALQEVAAGQQQIDAGQAQINEGQSEIDAGWQRINEAQEEINAGQAQLNSAYQELNNNGQQIANGQQQLSEGQSQLQSGRTQIENSEKQLNAAKSEIEKNEKQLAQGEAEIAENEKKLQDARSELEDGKKKLEEGQQEYEDAKADAEEEIADGERKIRDAELELEDLKNPEWLIYNREDLPEYSGYGDNAQRMKNIGQVFPLLFFLVAALVSLTTMTRMVEEQRTQIGTLKALGYGKMAIAAKYLLYAATATIGGSVLGVLFGEKVLPMIIIKAYGIMYIHMPNLVIPYEAKYSLIASMAALFCTLFATVASCGRELRETPAAMMRPPAPKAGKRVILEHLPFIWKHLNFTWKATVRNLFRYKKRFFMTIFGISGCMALLLVGYGLKDSIMDIAALQYDEIQRYTGIVITDEDATGSQKEALNRTISEIPEIQDYSRLYFHKMSAQKGKKNRDIYLYILEDTDKLPTFITLRDRISQEEYQLDDSGVIVSEKTAKMLDVKEGDTIVLQDDGRKGMEVTISQICENYMQHYIYMSPGLYEKMRGQLPEYTEYLFTVKDDCERNEQEIGSQILESEAAISISYTDSIRQQLNDMLQALDLVIVVLIVSAGMLAFVVLYNLNNISITERKRELATLKVLGFYDLETSAYVYRENIILTLIGIVVGSGLGILLHRFIITTVEVDACMFGRIIKPISFLYCALYTCAFSAFVNGIMHFKLKKIDMVESLKSVE